MHRADLLELLLVKVFELFKVYYLSLSMIIMFFVNRWKKGPVKTYVKFENKSMKSL
jgi:hypothetical protein